VSGGGPGREVPRILPGLARLLGTVALSVATAAAVAYGLWVLFPYHLLEAHDFEAAFFIWEATMWLTGLTLALFGLASLLGGSFTPHTMRDHFSHTRDVLRDASDSRREMLRGWSLGRLLPLSAGIALITIAAVARASLG